MHTGNVDLTGASLSGVACAGGSPRSCTIQQATNTLRPAPMSPSLRFMYSLRLYFVVPVWLLAASLSSIAAQTPAGNPGSGTERAKLNARLKVADSLGLTSEATIIRARLRDGDFSVGDRIEVRYEGDKAPHSDSVLVVELDRIVRERE